MSDQIKKIILDTDIGDDIDDAFALALALNSPEIELLGVTTVFRNSLKRAKLAKALIKSYGRDIKVYAGVDEPLVQVVSKLLPDEIKQKEQLDEDGKYLIPQYDYETMDNIEIQKLHAVDFIIDMVHKYENEIIIVPIGPLTNIALAIRKDPSIVKKIKKIVIMGGYDENKYPEWNIYCDPEAARIVYTSGANLYTVGLDVTLKCCLTPSDVDEFKQSKDQTNAMIAKMLDKWFEHYKFTTPVMHDPLAVSTLIDDFVDFEEKIVEVQLVEQRGSTIEVDTLTETSSLVNVGIKVDNERFLKMFKTRIFKNGGDN